MQNKIGSANNNILILHSLFSLFGKFLRLWLVPAIITAMCLELDAANFGE
jgi:hypothetical protein